MEKIRKVVFEGFPYPVINKITFQKKSCVGVVTIQTCGSVLNSCNYFIWRPIPGEGVKTRRGGGGGSRPLSLTVICFLQIADQ